MSLFTKRVTGLVSLLLIMVLLALTGCSNGQAVPRSRIQAQDAVVSLKPDLEQTPSKRPKERQELTAKRTRYSTRYVNPNGTFTEEIFMEPQFFHDPKDKQWKKIDNTLKLNKNRYENAANDMRIALAETAGTDAVFQLAIGDKSVAFLPVGAVKIKGKVKDNTLTYKGLYSNVDASYLVTGNSVKENIVLQEAGAPSKFTYELATQGVMPFQEKDGTVSFLDEANNLALWYLPRPFMYDAAGKTSGNVTMKLRTEGERRFLDLTADPAFLNAATTKYPVTIDPSVNNWDVIRDTFVASGVPTASYASSGSLFVGANPTYGTTRSLLQFSLRSLPSDSVISAASLNVYNTTAGTADSTVDLYRVTGAMATSPTWSTQPATAATAESSVTSNTANAYWTWYVTRLVKDWYNGIQANNGVQLRMRTETAAARAFSSVNSGTNTPRLTIDYTLDPIGLEPYWGYTKDTVNVANGNLVVQETDITTPGRGPEVTVTRVHNSRAAGQAGMFGYGWFSNLESVVWEATVGPATLLDEDRTRHVFGQNAAGQYEAAPDVKYQLVKNADGSYTVTKEDGYVVTHNPNGRIATIKDEAGNVARFNYDANNRLVSVADASGRLTAFAYGANGYVSSVTAPGNRVTTYAYDTAGNLTSVTDPSGTAVTFVYDATHRITQTKMGTAVTNVNYDASNRCVTVSKPVTVAGAVQNSTTTVAYDPANSTTSVTEPDGSRVNYIYNTILNLVSTVENAGAANEGVSTYGYDPNRNLTLIQDPLGNETDSPGYVITYENNLQRKTQLPTGEIATVDYDPSGTPIAATDFEANRQEMFYGQGTLATDLFDPLAQTSSTRYANGGLLQYSSYPIAAAENFAINASFELDLKHLHCDHA